MICLVSVAVKGKSGSACGYDGTTKRCAGLSTAGANPLARTTAECKAITSQQNSQHASAATAQANVDAAWNSMKAHVFGGAKKATAGTHLTKEWLEKNPKVKLQSNPKTGISVTVDGKSSKNSNPKTLWNNNRESGHQYTETDVERMCKAAISLVLAKLKTDTLPKSHTTQSFSVLAFGSTNICVSVQGDTSCFPMSNQIANAEAGQECDSR
ncbi:uncharacterized protein EV420DRAFT_1492091 [Desarmillaria tabescens]|uniref:Uncharacterized protein n=1 Tax=Armillaria tabescens TaxID=1929756 RepID=A0AA39U803_ARMTA|nr:uncharacterized protein EV420DRAFT_1492091 [Desarmillaria tabescens]KAK0469035.1 hypothetical protein EV420DRAFT_1492091 [Desarmillaria tabescens]